MLTQFKSFLENKLAIIWDSSFTQYDRIKKLTYYKICIYKRQKDKLLLNYFVNPQYQDP